MARAKSKRAAPKKHERIRLKEHNSKDPTARSGPQSNISTRPPVFLITRHEFMEETPKFNKEKARIKLFRFLKKLLRFCKESSSEDDFIQTVKEKEKRRKDKSKVLKRITDDNEYWFRWFYRAYSKKKANGILDDLSCTESSPVNTDAKEKVKRKTIQKCKEKCRERTWSNKYVEWLMNFSEFREIYLYYIQFLNEGSSDSTAEKFASALGMLPRPGLFEEFKTQYTKYEPGELTNPDDSDSIVDDCLA